MVIGHNFVRAGEFTESFPEKPPHRNSECFWRVFQKTIWFNLESGVRRGSWKIYGESKALCRILLNPLSIFDSKTLPANEEIQCIVAFTK